MVDALKALIDNRQRPKMAYPRKDGGTVDVRYRGRRIKVASDGTLFIAPERPSIPSPKMRGG